jgi:hypothetical protein
MTDPFNVATLFADLGFDIQGSDVDEAIRWALVELHLRRKGRSICESEFCSGRQCRRDAGHNGPCCDADPWYCTCGSNPSSSASGS